MIRDYSKTQVMWTRHALAEATEDNFKIRDIEKGLYHVVESPEFNGIKKRGIIRLDSRFCTLIYTVIGDSILMITCWESSHTDIAEYRRTVKRG